MAKKKNKDDSINTWLPIASSIGLCIGLLLSVMYNNYIYILGGIIGGLLASLLLGETIKGETIKFKSQKKKTNK